MGKRMVNEKIGDSWQSKPVINEAAVKIGIHRNDHDENYRNDDEIGQHPLPPLPSFREPYRTHRREFGKFCCMYRKKLGIFFLKKGGHPKLCRNVTGKGAYFPYLWHVYSFSFCEKITRG
jgi:hypothetical protein